MRVLTEPSNSLVRQYQHLFELDGMDLEFTHEALLAHCGACQRTQGRVPVACPRSWNRPCRISCSTCPAATMSPAWSSPASLVEGRRPARALPGNVPRKQAQRPELPPATLRSVETLGEEQWHSVTRPRWPLRADLGVSGIPSELAEARATIDNIDAALVHILAERFRCTQRVGHIKARLDLPHADPEREARQVERLRTLGGVLPASTPILLRSSWLHGPRGHSPPRGH